MAVTVQLFSKEASDQLQALADEAAKPAGLLKVLAARGSGMVRANFLQKVNVANKLGGRRTYWWWGVANSVSWRVTGASEAHIRVSKPGAALQAFGGTVTPKRTKALTIPIAPEAHGRTVAVFEQETGIRLFLLRKKEGGFTNLLAGVPEKGAPVKAYYLLAKSVDIPADPTALPPADQFQKGILNEAADYLERAASRKTR